MSLKEALGWLGNDDEIMRYSSNDHYSAFSDCLATLDVLRGIGRLAQNKLNYIEGI